jgi:methionine sulfoxide reductase heme-binding subunit
MSDQLWWYVARAGGLMAWVLVAVSVLWGLMLSTKVLGRRVRPNWILDLHRFVGALAVVFTGVHVAGLVLDSYVSFGPTELLVPFASAWRPAAVAWGVVALYLLVAIELTSLARRRLSKRVWHAVHLASFPLFAMGTVHALTAGSDTGTPWFRLVASAAAMAVVGLTVVRVRQATRPPAPRIPSLPPSGPRVLGEPHRSLVP